MMAQVVLPWPAPELSPNARIHKMKHARFKKAARSDAFYATKEAKIGIPAGDVPIAVHLLFQPPARYRYDEDGLVSRMKAPLDGIADALGVDDNFFRLTHAIGDPVKNGAVVVTFG